MKKKFIFIFLIFLLPKNIFAQNISIPTLQEVMQKNQEKIKKDFEEKNSPKKIFENNLILEDPKKIFTYKNIYSGNSIQIQKSNEENFYIADIDLSKGARVDGLLWGSGFVDKTGEPLFIKKSVNEAKSELLRKPKIIINGQFFNPTKNPTTLSFATKNNGIIRTAGADNKGELFLLTIKNNSAKIEPYSWKNLENSDADFAIASFGIEKKSYGKEKIGRTYICVDENLEKDFYKKIKIFFAQEISENDIENEMLKFDCKAKNSLQLDSSGSSRIVIDDEVIYGFAHKGEPDRRKIPHYILFFE